MLGSRPYARNISFYCTDLKYWRFARAPVGPSSAARRMRFHRRLLVLDPGGGIQAPVAGVACDWAMGGLDFRSTFRGNVLVFVACMGVYFCLFGEWFTGIRHFS